MTVARRRKISCKSRLSRLAMPTATARTQTCGTSWTPSISTPVPAAEPTTEPPSAVKLIVLELSDGHTEDPATDLEVENSAFQSFTDVICGHRPMLVTRQPQPLGNSRGNLAHGHCPPLSDGNDGRLVHAHNLRLLLTVGDSTTVQQRSTVAVDLVGGTACGWRMGPPSSTNCFMEPQRLSSRRVSRRPGLKER